LYTLLSEIILSSGIYNYTETTRLWRMRKYNTIISSQTSAEIWQKSTWAENTPPFPFPLQLNPCLQMAVYQNSCLTILPTHCHGTTELVQQAFCRRCHFQSREKVHRENFLI
jgi:hypothetical protein